jgi:peroxiredoxin
VRLRNTYDGNDVIIIGISAEDEKTIHSFAKKRRINYSLALEPNLPAPYADVTSLPTTFFIDREGIIRYVAEGYHDFEQLNIFVKGLDRKADPNE